MKQLMKEVADQEHGLLVTWEELAELADKVRQSYELLIVGFRDGSNLAELRPATDLSENWPIILELIDCSFWRVSAREPEVIRILRSKFASRDLQGPE